MPVPVGRSLRLRQRLPPAANLPPDLRPAGDDGDPPVDWRKLFGREAPIEVEVGFGTGRHLLYAAELRPGTNFLGIEHALACIRLTRYRADQRGIANMRLVDGEARDFLARLVPAASVRVIHVYFPDPWPKARHHKRRLVSPAFAAAAARALEPRGLLHVATDHDDYALVIAAAFAGEPALARQPSFAFAGDLAELTNYGTKAAREGKTLHAWTYAKQAD